MKKILTLTLALTLLGCQQSKKENYSTYNKSQQTIGAFIEKIGSDIQDDNIRGSISLVIVHKDVNIASKTFGSSDPFKRTAADSNTIYRIGSITKSFTGFLLLQLQQEGFLDINDPVEKYLPEIKSLIDYDKHTPITLKQLASHTSGIDRESGNRYANFGNIKQWTDKVTKAIPETSFRSKPGERFRYSNIGYAILGLAISKACNKPYIELIEEYILNPLEMDNTFFEIPKNKGHKLAQGMAGGPTAELNYDLPKQEHNGRGYRIPNGGIYSTPNDMAKFMKACMGFSDILDKEGLKLLQTSQTPTKRLRSNYSYGFDLYSNQGISTVGHRGSTPGYSAHFEFEINSKYGVIIMRNYNFGNTNLDLRSNALLRKLSRLE